MQNGNMLHQKHERCKYKLPMKKLSWLDKYEGEKPHSFSEEKGQKNLLKIETSWAARVIKPILEARNGKVYWLNHKMRKKMLKHCNW